MVIIDKEIPVRAMSPKVHIREHPTHASGSKKQAILRKRKSRITAMSRNVKGGSL